MFGQTAGASLEHLVLTNSKQFFKTYSTFPPPQHTYPNDATDKWRTAAKMVGSEAVKAKQDDEDIGDDDGNCCNKKWCWWTPPQNSIPVQFCSETSIHGFRFMGQMKRHLTERIFWFIAFCVSLSAAIYLIYQVWDKYQKSPVIVSFQATEQDIDSIPFPAVTLCNMNKFPKSKVTELEEIAANPTHSKNAEAKLQLTFVRSVCNAQQSFAKDFDFAYTRGTKDEASNNDTISEDNQDEMMDFLLENTDQCDQMIRLCILGEKIRNCSDLFKPIITDYGKCCVFNLFPLPIMLRNPQNKDKDMQGASIYKNPVLGNNGAKNWPMDEIKLWQEWNYDEGFVLTENQTRPWRQKRAGLPYGLSILVDPGTDEYFCPVSDSEGLRFILHTPLEMPHVNEFASVADLNKEILIEVHPDITNADDDIRHIEHDKRKCYFGKEKKLKFYGPYTGGNCVDECTAIVMQDSCNCTFFYMPRDDGIKICNNDPDSADYKCIDKARVDLQTTLKEKCGHCDTLCEDIAYNYETTIATLQNNSQLWKDVDFPSGKKVPKWADNKMSILHFFFGAETTVPKYRKRLYGTTDLIANTGGILGLCLGFSVLSGVEIAYFLTIRSFFKYCRRRNAGKRLALKFVKLFKSKPNNRVIRVNPNRLSVYPGLYPGYGNGGNVYGNGYGGISYNAMRYY